MKNHPIYTLYMIGENGDVIDTKTNRKRNTYIHTNGYIQVSIQDENGSLKMKRVHRLVAETFLTESEFYGLDVNHVDGDKTNNNLTNLEWCTRSHNIKHAKRIGLNKTIGSTHFATKLDSETVHKICRDLSEGVGNNTVSLNHKVDKSIIANIKNGRAWLDISSLYNIPKTSKPRLSDKDIVDLYLNYHEGLLSLEELSRKYNVSKETVKRIGSKKTHKRLIDNALNDYRNYNTNCIGKE